MINLGPTVGIHPTGRQGVYGMITELREPTAAALFLASGAAGYLSGHTLVADGGRITTRPKI